ncbi:hypothetical protein BCE75_102394 [Isoptericola sp. CG 20/1183]|uniref:Prevent-host-death family protein n=1 Tax=Isoptericola halotolerans TaxID=300560 RepID=A0ABX5EJ16_9MICO|nr:MULTISPECIES: hypothetical protein [Isoptericola]MCK0118797.1 hypothetical protein [Isoptericola sp. S6320L]PRZ09680.1 hypothetical protein BCE75_102394 [Isoptericola sp. CG 20/1183]PRZ10481.1 hypothetical protein BCL65_101626 [Isoptericola halotolerans]
MDTMPPRDTEVADPDEVVDELIAYDAAALRRATATTQAVPVVPARSPGRWVHGRLPDEFTD